MADSLSLDELASLPEFAHPAASPDGDRVAVYYDGTGRNELHVLDVETGELRQVSDGEVPRDTTWPFAWAPDGDSVYFHRDDAGDEQNDIWELDLTGDVSPVIERDGQCTLCDVTDDGQFLYACVVGDGKQLFRYDRDADDHEQLTDYEYGAMLGHLSPDWERIAYAANESDDLDNVDAYVADADGSNPRKLDVGEDGYETLPVGWSSDGTRLLLTDDTEDTERPGVYDLETETVEWFGSERVEYPVAFLPDGDGFLALRTRRAGVIPVAFSDDGTSREFDLPEGVSTFPGVQGPTPPNTVDELLLADGRVLVEQETTDQRPALLAYDLADGTAETLLEPGYDDVDPDQFVEAEYFRFESHDGTEIGGLLYDSGERPSPAVVKIHGGPAGQDRKAFDRKTQFLVSRGYTVLQVNYRGSIGRGREFERLLHDDWGGDEQEDVAEGVRWLAEKEWIDEDRIVAFGGSYGGYSAYWQVVQYPELYAAGIAWVGVTDLHDMHENTMPHFQTHLMEKYMGDPDENHELYRERSPVEHVQNLDSPLLMVHGVNDRRVPVSQARIFRDALEEAGYEAGRTGDYEYEELGEEGHGSSDIQQKIRTFRLIDDFLDRRIEN